MHRSVAGNASKSWMFFLLYLLMQTSWCGISLGLTIVPTSRYSLWYNTTLAQIFDVWSDKIIFAGGTTIVFLLTIVFCHAIISFTFGMSNLVFWILTCCQCPFPCQQYRGLRQFCIHPPSSQSRQSTVQLSLKKRIIVLMQCVPKMVFQKFYLISRFFFELETWNFGLM